MQEKIFNEHIIRQFFSNITVNDRYSTLKELVLLGINSINQSINNQGNYQHEKQNKMQLTHLSKKQLIRQVENMKNKIDCLASAIQQQDQISNTVNFKENNNPLNPIVVTDKNGFNLIDNININHCGSHTDYPQKVKLTPKITQTIPIFQQQYNQTNQASNINQRYKNRQHLDDSQVRSALINPYAIESQKKKNYNKIRKDIKFVHQQQVDKEQLKILHKNRQKQQNMGRFKQSRASYTNNLKAESKIKSLVEKDKLKHREANNYLDLQKYQYSSQESQMQQEQASKKNQNAIEEEEQSSSFNETNRCKSNNISNSINAKEKKSKIKDPTISKKNNKQKYQQKQPSYNNQSMGSEIQFYQGKQYSENSDKVSESSSFSKFSLNSQRQVGRISGRNN